jgi:hypothetical protein
MTGWLDRREREALAYLRRQSRLGGLLISIPVQRDQPRIFRS